MLRKHLLEDLDQVFPEEIESYREIRASAAAVIFSLDFVDHLWVALNS